MFEHPFRSTKTQVLSDLPEKTEQTIFCELGEKQRKAYDELREHYRQELTGRIGRMGIGRPIWCCRSGSSQGGWI